MLIVGHNGYIYEVTDRDCDLIELNNLDEWINEEDADYSYDYDDIVDLIRKDRLNTSIKEN